MKKKEKKAAGRCRCLFYHPSGEERQQVVKALEYARSIGDTTGTMIALGQLSGCPTRNR